MCGWEGGRGDPRAILGAVGGEIRDHACPDLPVPNRITHHGYLSQNSGPLGFSVTRSLYCTQIEGCKLQNYKQLKLVSRLVYAFM